MLTPIKDQCFFSKHYIKAAFHMDRYSIDLIVVVQLTYNQHDIPHLEVMERHSGKRRKSLIDR